MGEEVLGSFVIEKFRLLKVNITYRLLFTRDRLVTAGFKSVKDALFINDSGRVPIGLAEALKQDNRIPEIPGLRELRARREPTDRTAFPTGACMISAATTSTFRTTPIGA